MPPKTSRYSEALKNWAKKSSFHGIPQICISGNYVVKFVWLCCILVSGFACGKTVVTNLIDYFSYSVDTVLELGRESQQPVFPTVTICRLHVCGLDGQKYSQLLDDFLQNQNKSGNFSPSDTDISALFQTFKVKKNLSTVFWGHTKNLATI